jgi:hypothetical protein
MQTISLPLLSFEGYSFLIYNWYQPEPIDLCMHHLYAGCSILNPFLFLINTKVSIPTRSQKVFPVVRLHVMVPPWSSCWNHHIPRYAIHSSIHQTIYRGRLHEPQWCMLLHTSLVRSLCNFHHWSHCLWMYPRMQFIKYHPLCPIKHDIQFQW